MTVSFQLNGSQVVANEVDSAGASRNLMDVLRNDLDVVSVKDGCAPQGQCGCCTVLIDGKARVSCVTPVSRVSGRQVETIEGWALRQ